MSLYKRPFELIKFISFAYELGIGRGQFHWTRSEAAFATKLVSLQSEQLGAYDPGERNILLLLIYLIINSQNRKY